MDGGDGGRAKDSARDSRGSGVRLERRVMVGVSGEGRGVGCFLVLGGEGAGGWSFLRRIPGVGKGMGGFRWQGKRTHKGEA
jgi:hypothetical protein